MAIGGFGVNFKLVGGICGELGMDWGWIWGALWWNFKLVGMGTG